MPDRHKKKAAPAKANRTKRPKKTDEPKRAKQPQAPKATEPDDTKPLNGRQEAFCRAYIRPQATATSAYQEAYGNDTSAEAASSRLLTSVKVQERIAALRAEAAAGDVLTLNESLRYLTRVVRTPIGTVDEMSDLCQEYTRTEEGGMRGKLKRGKEDSGNEEYEQEYTVIKIKVPDKLRALELAAKMGGYLKESVSLEAGDTLAKLLGDIRAGQ